MVILSNCSAPLTLADDCKYGRSPLSLMFVSLSLSPALSMCLASSIFPPQSNLSWFFCCSVVAAYLVPMPSLPAHAPSQRLCLFLVLCPLPPCC